MAILNDDIIVTKPRDCVDDVSIECEEEQMLRDERLIFPVSSSRNPSLIPRHTTESIVHLSEGSGNFEDDDDGEDDDEDGEEDEDEDEDGDEDDDEEDGDDEDEDEDDEDESEIGDGNANINMKGGRGGTGKNDDVTKASTNQNKAGTPGQRNNTKHRQNPNNNNNNNYNQNWSEGKPHRRQTTTANPPTSSTVTMATKKPNIPIHVTYPLPHAGVSSGYIYSNRPPPYLPNSNNPHDFSSTYSERKDRNGPNQTAINMNIILIAGIAAGIVVLLFILVVAACKFYASSSGAAAAKALNDYQRTTGKSAYAYEACNTGVKCSSPLLAPASQQSLPAVNALAQTDGGGAVVGAANPANSQESVAKPAKKDVKEWYV